MLVSIRSRLLSLVLAALLPGLLGVAWLVGRTFEAERQAHERTLRETTRALSMVVDAELAQRATVARVLAQSRRLDELPPSRDDLLGFDLQVRRTLQDMDGWAELRGPQGLLVDTRLPEGTLPAPTAQTQGEPALLTEIPVVQPLSLGATRGEETHAAVIQPVQRGGQTVYNLVVTLRPAELQRIIDRQNLPPDWVATAMDNRGTVVARRPGGLAYVGRQATPDLQARMATANEGLFESRSLEGMPTAGYFNTAPSGWTFITAMPRTQYAGLLPSAVTQVAFGSLVLLAMAVLGALWVARGIVRPVQALKGAAARLQAGRQLEYIHTGIAECDEVGHALADAARTLQRSRAELQRQVADAVARTRQAEQRVGQSQRVEALGRLTGGVAHDFNNLLGVISNSAHLIQRQAEDQPAIQAPVAATLRAVEVGSRLTQHLLRFAGRRPVRPQALELARYLPELQELMRSVLGRQINISVQVAPDTRAVRVDSSELELALINLALNARDAMPNGGELHLRARNALPQECEDLQPGAAYVLLTVGDDGPGIPPDVAARVFEPFFTTKPVGKGTGLGLSQVHGFATQAGGTARLDSTEGVGTTVSLLLPAGDEGAADAPPPPEAAQPLAIAGARVLLVEDNDELAGVTESLLQSHGAQVLHASDASQALALLATQPRFDVVLSDVVMPGTMDGLALARQLRRDRPDLPVVLISGYVAAEAATREFTVLRKPCAQDELLAALQAAMRPQATEASRA